MNILYCGDYNIKEGLIVSILSLLKQVEEKLNIYVITINYKDENYNIKGVSDNIIEIIDKKVKEKNSSSFVKKIDITELFKKDIPKINMTTRFTPCCMLRLYSDIIEELPEKLLYLDYDVVCRKNCTEFYNQDISDYELVGTLDYYGRWFFKNNMLKMDYLNSGVLLLNLKKIKETRLFEKCRKLCIDKKMFMPDQSAINKLAVKKKIVPRKYNEQRKLHEDTVFQHFTTSFRFFPILHTFVVKPWQIESLHKKLKIYEYDDILEEYKTQIKRIENIEANEMRNINE